VATHNVRDLKKMSISKKSAKPTARGKFKDMKAKTNPKGGGSFPLNPVDLNLGTILNQGSSGGSKSPNVGSIVIGKTTDSASPNLYKIG